MVSCKENRSLVDMCNIGEKQCERNPKSVVKVLIWKCRILNNEGNFNSTQ
jgi:hypothetical protein